MAERTLVKKVKNGALYSDGTVRIDNVRFSHPHIDKAWGGKDDDGKEQAKKFSVVGLAPKTTHGEVQKLLVQVINDILKENKLERLSSDKKFVRDGDQAGKPECDGMWTISAREDRRPAVRDADGAKMRDETEIREKFYGGAYGNILIRPWFQKNKFGTRVNAGLSAIQFLRDGEPFGEGGISDDEVDETFGISSDGDDDNGGFDEDDLGGL